MGVCCVFSTHVISVAKKDFHVLNPNFLVPFYSFFAVKGDSTAFDSIDRFPTYGCCRYEQRLVCLNQRLAMPVD